MTFYIVSVKKTKLIWTIPLLASVLLLFVFSNPLLNRAQEVWGTPLAGKRIMIDPGHGGSDGGAVSASGIQEKDITLKISYYVKDFLQGSGAYVMMTRETDRDLSDPMTQGLSRKKAEDLKRRVQMVKDNNMDMMVSIHLNAIPLKSCFGAQTFFNPTNDHNKRLALSIQKELVGNLGNTMRIAKQKNDTYLLRQLKVASVLVEAGFLSNPQEAVILTNESYQKKVAAAIYYGIMDYYSNHK